MTTLPIPTKDGIFLARYSEDGLIELHFPGRQADEAGEGTELIREWHALTTQAVFTILEGRALQRVPPLDLSGHTDFRRKVWEHLQRIRLGETESYAEVAAAIGQVGATRAVGGACGANPIPLITPCHRVVQMGGGIRGLGGFSGGLDWKRKLLASEGVVFEAEGGGPEQEVFAGFEKQF